MSNSYELSTVYSWSDIRKLKKQRIITDESYKGYLHYLFEIHHKAEKFHLWNDSEYQLKTLGFEEPASSYNEL